MKRPPRSIPHNPGLPEESPFDGIDLPELPRDRRVEAAEEQVIGAASAFLNWEDTASRRGFPSKGHALRAMKEAIVLISVLDPDRAPKYKGMLRDIVEDAGIIADVGKASLKEMEKAARAEYRGEKPVRKSEFEEESFVPNED